MRSKCEICVARGREIEGEREKEREKEKESSEAVKFLFDRNTNFRMLSDTYNRCIAAHYCIMLVQQKIANCTAFLFGQKGFTRETVIVWCCVLKVYITPYRKNIILCCGCLCFALCLYKCSDALLRSHQKIKQTTTTTTKRLTSNLWKSLRAVDHFSSSLSTFFLFFFPSIQFQFIYCNFIASFCKVVLLKCNISLPIAVIRVLFIYKLRHDARQNKTSTFILIIEAMQLKTIIFQ